MTVIREFNRRPRGEASVQDTRPGQSTENLNLLIQRIAGASLDEIDLVILELKRVRETLHSESKRLSGDIARYGSLNQSLMAAVKVISESLKQWNGAPINREQAIADFKARWLGGEPS